MADGAARAPIVFGGGGRSETSNTANDKPSSALDVERQKHQQRAQRFNMEYKDPSKRSDLDWEAKKERVRRSGFATGIDMLSAEEVEKRAKRAERFGTAQQDPLAIKVMQPSEEDARKRERAARFGTRYDAPDATGLMDVDLLETRKEAQADVERRHDAIHLYGVDLMTTKDVLNYFSDYGPSFVEWINDSSCNVCFEDSHSAARAIIGMGVALPPQDTPDGQGGLFAADVAKVEMLWHKGPNFEKGGVQIPLLFRLATMNDVKDPDARAKSRGLWLIPVKQAQRAQQHGGTVGTRRVRRRKVRRRPHADGAAAGDGGAAAAGGSDVDMEDVYEEEEEADGGDQPPHKAARSAMADHNGEYNGDTAAGNGGAQTREELVAASADVVQPRLFAAAIAQVAPQHAAGQSMAQHDTAEHLQQDDVIGETS